MKKLEDRIDSLLSLLESPYYRIRFSYYFVGKYMNEGSLYLYLPKGIDEQKIINFLSQRKFCEDCAQFTIKNFDQVHFDTYLNNKGKLFTNHGTFSLKRKFVLKAKKTEVKNNQKQKKVGFLKKFIP